MSKQHDVSDALATVRQKGAEEHDGHLVIDRTAPIGIKAWGKLDFLTGKCGYVLNRVENPRRFIKSLQETGFQPRTT